MTIVEATLGSPLVESSTAVLETGRLLLRVPRIEDMTWIAELADNRKVAEMTANIPHPYGMADAASFVANLPGGPEAATFAIFLKNEAALRLPGQPAFGPAIPVGMCGFNRRDEDVPEIGYWLGEPYWDHGIATEAVRALIDHAFGDRKLTALTASARVVNPASRGVLEKCGFQWTGVGLARVRAIGASVPVDRFRLERRLWTSLRAWGATQPARLHELEAVRH
ncbi:GNAT family N-acetyltransferase [Ancylobacter polymorphus]|jgi:RimJ/RimL family protein N-acetyltransferase|uniref:GNAT family N-acetyltransferase n=1 Tax=Ancylobacter polymorphus TaxID=223390 RepID=A0A9E7D569_9HYPH|nr:GNAT family N-acetyltransferase [Ancylobacter polymorphus]UOK72457.1 GNAT family N-acetyltransferase [Ancylobacter polymorphus]